MRISDRQADEGAESQRRQLAQLAPLFPPHFLAQIVAAKGRGGAPGVPIDPVRVHGTCLVADMRGFSAAARRLLAARSNDGARALVDLVNQFFATGQAVVDAFGGSTVTFDGDALVAFFEGTGHAEMCVATAVELWRRTAAQAAGHADRISCGVSSGTFVSAGVGDEHSRVHVLLGDAGSEAVRARRSGGDGVMTAPSTATLLGPPGVTRTAGSVTHASPAWAAVPSACVGRVLAALAPHLPTIGPLPARADFIGSLRPIAAAFVNVDGIATAARPGGTEGWGIVERFFGETVAIARRHGGILNKVNQYHVGDKYLLLFGCDNDGTTVEWRDAAMRAALELQRLVIELRMPARQRIGLSAGLGVVCAIGTPSRYEVTAMGAPVNEAVHLMELARWGEVVATVSAGASSGGGGGSSFLGPPERVILKGDNAETLVERHSASPSFSSDRPADAERERGCR